MIKKDKQEVIDLLLENFQHDREFETEDFYYWIKEIYRYSGDEVNREEFQAVKDYAIKHGTLPFIKINDKIADIRLVKAIRESKKESGREVSTSRRINLYNKNTDTGTYCRQIIIRYSKKYHNLDVYDFEIEVRAPASKPISRVLVMTKKQKIFSVNDKNYVLIGGRRWLSLKNWSGFSNRSPKFITEKVVKKLMSLMLGSANLIDEFNDIKSINISNSSARKAKSIDEAIQNECGAKPAKIIKRALSNDVNEIISLYRLIDPNQVHNLTNFIKRNHDKLNKLLNSDSYSHRKSNSLLFFYYLSKDNRLINKSDIAHDYIRMSEQEGLKINLNISSARTIKNRHDEISRAIVERNKDKSRLRVSKDYPRISKAPGMEIELIRSAERLNLESKILNHCVHSYKSSVNSGSCAIYSLLFEGERYTLEVKSNKIETPKGEEKPEVKIELSVNQLRGKYNCNPPLGMEKYFKELCDENQFKIPRGRVVFEPKNLENKKSEQENKIEEVKQVGEGILSVLIHNTMTTDRELPF